MTTFETFKFNALFVFPANNKNNDQNLVLKESD